MIRKIWPWSGDNLTNRAGMKRLHGLIMPSLWRIRSTVAKIPTLTRRPLYIAKQKAYNRPIRSLVKFYVLSFKCIREYLELEWQLFALMIIRFLYVISASCRPVFTVAKIHEVAFIFATITMLLLCSISAENSTYLCVLSCQLVAKTSMHANSIRKVIILKNIQL